MRGRGILVTEIPEAIRLRRLARNMSLSPANCKKAMTAYIQAVAVFGSGLWWKSDQAWCTNHRLLPDHQPGKFVNEGAASQVENRLRRLRLRLLSLRRAARQERLWAPALLCLRLRFGLFFLDRIKGFWLL